MYEGQANPICLDFGTAHARSAAPLAFGLNWRSENLTFDVDKLQPSTGVITDS
jgi:hypothetical protein